MSLYFLRISLYPLQISHFATIILLGANLLESSMKIPVSAFNPSPRIFLSPDVTRISTYLLSIFLHLPWMYLLWFFLYFSWMLHSGCHCLSVKSSCTYTGSLTLHVSLSRPDLLVCSIYPPLYFLICPKGWSINIFGTRDFLCISWERYARNLWRSSCIVARFTYTYLPLRFSYLPPRISPHSNKISLYFPRISP